MFLTKPRRIRAEIPRRPDNGAGHWHFDRLLTRRPLCQLSYTGGDVLMVAETADRVPPSMRLLNQQHAQLTMHAEDENSRDKWLFG
jgi:hypothetical protein